MAGTLVIDTLKASSGVLATQNGMTGICKAWVDYNGSTQTIANSFNVSSVTYNSSGNYTVNFTTAMPNSNYVIQGTTSRNASTDNGVIVNQDSQTARTTSAVRVTVFQVSVGSTDKAYVGIAVFA